MKRAMLVMVFSAVAMVACGGGPVYYANVPPPPIRAEVVGVAPGPGYVWVGGYWGWSGLAHVWVPGRWAVPPHRHARWVEPRWDRDGRHYRFHEGHRR